LPTHIFPIQADHDDESTVAGAGGASWVASTPCHPTPATASSYPVDRVVQIVKVDPRQSTEFDQDPRPQTIAIHNLESAVRPHLNATL